MLALTPTDAQLRTYDFPPRPRLTQRCPPFPPDAAPLPPSRRSVLALPLSSHSPPTPPSRVPKTLAAHIPAQRLALRSGRKPGMIRRGDTVWTPSFHSDPRDAVVRDTEYVEDDWAIFGLSAFELADRKKDMGDRKRYQLAAAAIRQIKEDQESVMDSYRIPRRRLGYHYSDFAPRLETSRPVSNPIFPAGVMDTAHSSVQARLATLRPAIRARETQPSHHHSFPAHGRGHGHRHRLSASSSVRHLGNADNVKHGHQSSVESWRSDVASRNSWSGPPRITSAPIREVQWETDSRLAYVHQYPAEDPDHGSLLDLFPNATESEKDLMWLPEDDNCLSHDSPLRELDSRRSSFWSGDLLGPMTMEPTTMQLASPMAIQINSSSSALRQSHSTHGYLDIFDAYHTPEESPADISLVPTPPLCFSPLPVDSDSDSEAPPAFERELGLRTPEAALSSLRSRSALLLGQTKPPLVAGADGSFPPAHALSGLQRERGHLNPVCTENGNDFEMGTVHTAKRGQRVSEAAQPVLRPSPTVATLRYGDFLLPMPPKLAPTSPGLRPTVYPCPSPSYDARAHHRSMLDASLQDGEMYVAAATDRFSYKALLGPLADLALAEEKKHNKLGNDRFRSSWMSTASCLSVAPSSMTYPEDLDSMPPCMPRELRSDSDSTILPIATAIHERERRITSPDARSTPETLLVEYGLGQRFANALQLDLGVGAGMGLAAGGKAPAPRASYGLSVEATTTGVVFGAQIQGARPMSAQERLVLDSGVSAQRKRMGHRRSAASLQ